MVDAICKELEMRKHEIHEKVETIYLGGGTPSLLNMNELHQIFDSVYTHFSVVENPEITLEANPDDLSVEKLNQLKTTTINRFSIGIQSFFDEDLRLMNRAHNAEEAIHSVKITQDAGFENITIDLIYGGQTTTDEMWKKNLEMALELKVPHISSYALTIESKTILHHQIKTKKIKDIDEYKQERQFREMIKTLTQNDFIHYEISNFGKEGFQSQHNSNYWKGKPYLGIGPSAHSYDGKNRSWNLANNSIYIQKMKKGELALETEELSENDRFNELIMIRLRTKEGLDLKEVADLFPLDFLRKLEIEIQEPLENRLLEKENNQLRITRKGLFLSDGIASRLFRV